MQGIGAQWHNIHKPATADDDFSIIDVILMMLADTGIMFLVTWYLENVKPGQFGMPKPFYFCFTVSWGVTMQTDFCDTVNCLCAGAVTITRA